MKPNQKPPMDHASAALWQTWIGSLLAGEINACSIEPDGQMCASAPPPGLVVPGSFNPLHEGHRRLAEAAMRMTTLPAAFELSLTNVDKPPLTAEAAASRARQFQWLAPVWLTCAPLFVDKARRFPKAAFAIGADTAARLIDPAYYGGDSSRLAASLEAMRRHGCRFLVAGRLIKEGAILRLQDLAVPAPFLDLFQEIPPELCRVDVSSTALRARDDSGG